MRRDMDPSSPRERGNSPSWRVGLIFVLAGDALLVAYSVYTHGRWFSYVPGALLVAVGMLRMSG